MLISRTSTLTGVVNTMDLPVTLEEIKAWEQSRALVQRSFPHLTSDQREFLISGATPEEWDEAFPEIDDETDSESPPF